MISAGKAVEVLNQAFEADPSDRRILVYAMAVCSRDREKVSLKIQERLTMKQLSQVDPDKFYLVEELAELVRVSPRTIRRYCNYGFIKAQKLCGKSWRILGREFYKFLGVDSK